MTGADQRTVSVPDLWAAYEKHCRDCRQCRSAWKGSEYCAQGVALFDAALDSPRETWKP